MHKTIQKVSFTTKQIRQLVANSEIGLILFLEILVGVVVTACASYLFTELSETVLSNERVLFDGFISNLIIGLRTPELTNVMILVSLVGSYGLVIGALVSVLVLFYKRHKKEAAIFSVMVAMGALINVLLKVLVQRPRPDVVPLILQSDYSFPSGHSMNAFIFFTTIAYFVFHFTRNKMTTAIVSTVCILTIVLIGVSRIYLGVHYPSDVVGGYIAGLTWFTTIIVIDRTIIFYHLFKESRRGSA